ncbi:LysM peptidoglycan-binding domain-containing protein [Antribacter sp. KLBMP9083]|uniref:LysM peptidoglycan-binding domain-containing protein n=1 Tax=Antribacter soli TaxID=2910976 RepID=A0AA41QFY0_9MICO|nr:LysM domain-containing protein [Antribacter soli]MCF4122396.1 LysM peptidoglycan-binding domain-containing protein [Antribacter soli]
MTKHAISPPSRQHGGIAALLALGLGLSAAAALLGLRAHGVAAAVMGGAARASRTDGSPLGTGALGLLQAENLGVDAMVELLVIGAGAIAAAWVGLSALLALACGLTARAGRRWTAGERLVARSAPFLVRRLAHAAVGAGIGLALVTPTAIALPAPAAGAGSTPEAESAPHVLDLGWQPTTAAPADGAAPEAAAPPDGGSLASEPSPAAPGGIAGGPAVPGQPDNPATETAFPVRVDLADRGLPGGGGRPPTVVVVPGDTLWEIAAAHLGGSPPAAEIAEAVARWYAGNRAAVGADPDLILPGQTLRAPSA